jgi:hypothetical protein
MGLTAQQEKGTTTMSDQQNDQQQPAERTPMMSGTVRARPVTAADLESGRVTKGGTVWVRRDHAGVVTLDQATIIWVRSGGRPLRPGLVVDSIFGYEQQGLLLPDDGVPDFYVEDPEGQEYEVTPVWGSAALVAVRMQGQLPAEADERLAAVLDGGDVHLRGTKYWVVADRRVNIYARGDGAGRGELLAADVLEIEAINLPTGVIVEPIRPETGS